MYHSEQLLVSKTSMQLPVTPKSSPLPHYLKQAVTYMDMQSAKQCEKRRVVVSCAQCSRQVDGHSSDPESDHVLFTIRDWA